MKRDPETSDSGDKHESAASAASEAPVSPFADASDFAADLAKWDTKFDALFGAAVLGADPDEPEIEVVANPSTTPVVVARGRAHTVRRGLTINTRTDAPILEMDAEPADEPDVVAELRRELAIPAAEPVGFWTAQSRDSDPLRAQDVYVPLRFRLGAQPPRAAHPVGVWRPPADRVVATELPTSADAHLLRGQLLVWDGHLREARTHFAAAISDRTTGRAAHRGLLHCTASSQRIWAHLHADVRADAFGELCEAEIALVTRDATAAAKVERLARGLAQPLARTQLLESAAWILALTPGSERPRHEHWTLAPADVKSWTSLARRLDAWPQVAAGIWLHIANLAQDADAAADALRRSQRAAATLVAERRSARLAMRDAPDDAASSLRLAQHTHGAERAHALAAGALRAQLADAKHLWSEAWAAAPDRMWPAHWLAAGLAAMSDSARLASVWRTTSERQPHNDFFALQWVRALGTLGASAEALLDAAAGRPMALAECRRFGAQRADAKLRLAGRPIDSADSMYWFADSSAAAWATHVTAAEFPAGAQPEAASAWLWLAAQRMPPGTVLDAAWHQLANAEVGWYQQDGVVALARAGKADLPHADLRAGAALLATAATSREPGRARAALARLADALGSAAPGLSAAWAHMATAELARFASDERTAATCAARAVEAAPTVGMLREWFDADLASRSTSDGIRASRPDLPVAGRSEVARLVAGWPKRVEAEQARRAGKSGDEFIELVARGALWDAPSPRLRDALASDIAAGRLSSTDGMHAMWQFALVAEWLGETGPSHYERARAAGSLAAQRRLETQHSAEIVAEPYSVWIDFAAAVAGRGAVPTPMAAQHPELARAWSERGATLAERRAQIESTLTTTAADGRTRAALLTRAGDAARQSRELETATHFYRDALQADPAYEPARLRWMRAAAAGQMWLDLADAALVRSESGRDDASNAHRAHLAAVALMDRALEANRAIAVLTPLAYRADAGPDVIVRLATLLEEGARYDDVYTLWNQRAAREVDERRAAAHRRAGTIARNFLGDRGAAVRHLIASLEQEPDPVTLESLADIAWEEGRWADAVGFLRGRLALGVPPALARAINLRLGTLLLRLRRLREATAAFNEVLLEEPDNVPALEGTLEAASGLGDYGLALRAAEQLIHALTEPHARIEALFRIADLFETQMNEPRRAERAIIAALETDPTHGEALERLARFYERHHDPAALRVQATRFATMARQRFAQQPDDATAAHAFVRAMTLREHAGVGGSLLLANLAADIARAAGASMPPVEGRPLAPPRRIDVRALELIVPTDAPAVLRLAVSVVADILRQRPASEFAADDKIEKVGRDAPLRLAAAEVARQARVPSGDVAITPAPHAIFWSVSRPPVAAIGSALAERADLHVAALSVAFAGAEFFVAPLWLTNPGKLCRLLADACRGSKEAVATRMRKHLGTAAVARLSGEGAALALLADNAQLLQWTRRSLWRCAAVAAPDVAELVNLVRFVAPGDVADLVWFALSDDYLTARAG